MLFAMVAPVKVTSVEMIKSLFEPGINLHVLAPVKATRVEVGGLFQPAINLSPSACDFRKPDHAWRQSHSGCRQHDYVQPDDVGLRQRDGAEQHDDRLQPAGTNTMKRFTKTDLALQATLPTHTYNQTSAIAYF